MPLDMPRIPYRVPGEGGAGNASQIRGKLSIPDHIAMHVTDGDCVNQRR